MAVFKMTMLFELGTTVPGGGGLGRVGGWSESWYWDGLLSSASTYFLDLCLRRAALLPTSGRIVGQRYQQVDPTVGASQVGASVYPGTGGILNDVPQMAVLVKVPALGGRANIRQWAMRGIPDARVVTGEFNPSSSWTSAFTSFKAGLGNFRFRGRQLDAEQAEINFIDEQGIATLNGPITTSAGTMVKVKSTRTEDGKPFTGVFKVGTGPTSTVVPLVNWKAGFCERGKMQLQVIIYPQVDQGNVVQGRVILKKVGRSFTGYRGRRSKRR